MTPISDPTRRRVLGLLAERERTAGEIAAAFTISRPAISRHLRVLREAGLVRVRPRAQQRVYALDPRPLDDVDAWLDVDQGVLGATARRARAPPRQRE